MAAVAVSLSSQKQQVRINVKELLVLGLVYRIHKFKVVYFERGSVEEEIELIYKRERGIQEGRGGLVGLTAT
jgi:hypothetical protein